MTSFLLNANINIFKEKSHSEITTSKDTFKNVYMLNLKIKLCANNIVKRDIKQLDNNLRKAE